MEMFETLCRLFSYKVVYNTFLTLYAIQDLDFYLLLFIRFYKLSILVSRKTT